MNNPHKCGFHKFTNSSRVYKFFLVDFFLVDFFSPPKTTVVAVDETESLEPSVCVESSEYLES